MVVAVYHDGEWFILDDLTNLLLREFGKTRLRASRCFGLHRSAPLSFRFLDGIALRCFSMILAFKDKLLEGKKGLIVGIANEQSIAWGCAKAFRAF
jgi:hypothetical protein